MGLIKVESVRDRAISEELDLSSSLPKERNASSVKGNSSDTSVTYIATGQLFILLGGLVLLGLGCFFLDWAVLVWLALLILLSIGVIFDIVWLLRCHISLIGTELEHKPTVQRPFAFAMNLKADLLPATQFMLKALDNDLLIPSKENAHLERLDNGNIRALWELFPKRRGDLEWPGANALYKTRLGLIEKWQRIGKISIAVYPALIRDLQNQLNPNLLIEQMGLKANRHLRSDQEFESLRPYVLGDNYRHIDWKASARMNSLITRQFQVEHHHNILICLDRSRLMGTLTEGISKLDWAIEATLHLAYLASRFQDRIGLLVFSNEIDRWVKPVNHPVEAFLNSVYDLECKIVEANFNQVCMSVMTAQKKRSLVIFISDFLDASSLEPSLHAFGQLNRKHSSLFIGVEDPAYKRYLKDQNGQFSIDFTRKIVAQGSLERRRAVLEKLRQMGLRTVTVSPENLIQRAVEAYIEIKFQGAI